MRSPKRWLLHFCLSTAVFLSLLLWVVLDPQPATMQSCVSGPCKEGRWSPVIPLGHIPIHMHAVPDPNDASKKSVRLLSWSRDQVAGQDIHETQTYLWSPPTTCVTGNCPTTAPTAAGKIIPNLFCAGHSFHPSGQLVVTGGHYKDAEGTETSFIYDYLSGWFRLNDMNANELSSSSPTLRRARWYPSNVTLGNGEVLVAGGTYWNGQLNYNGTHQIANNTLPQVLTPEGRWRDLISAQCPGNIDPITHPNACGLSELPYYPWMHVLPNGRVFVSGYLPQSRYLDTIYNGGNGQWVTGPTTKLNKDREYGSSVMYEPGKVVIIGGSQFDGTGHVPTNTAEYIDLNGSNPQWAYTLNTMQYARRHMNATLLPDGKVLVTGGTAGYDTGNPATDTQTFNAVLAAECWDPQTQRFTTLASMATRRMYHSSAVLLPDGRVVTGGGGRPSAFGDVEHPDVEIFSPPYLFKADNTLRTATERPQILSAPDAINYQQQFTVNYSTPSGTSIAKVHLIGLSSTTHAYNMGQRLFKYDCSVAGQCAMSGGQLTLTGPMNGNYCPPGMYMLFLLDNTGVPSVAKIVNVGGSNFMRLSPPPINSSSYRNDGVARDSLVSLFLPKSVNLPPGSATTRPLPTTLNGVRIEITTPSNASVNMGLSSISGIINNSYQQVNAYVPNQLTSGSTLPEGGYYYKVYNGSVCVAQGPLQLRTPAPGISTKNASGFGAPAMLIYRYNSQPPYNLISIESPTMLPPPNQSYMAPVQVNRPNEIVYFILYGTGVKYSSSLPLVYAPPAEDHPPSQIIPGLTVEFAGYYGYEGADQINMRVSPTMAGRGVVEFILGSPDPRFPGSVRRSNKVTVNFQ